MPLKKKFLTIVSVAVLLLIPLTILLYLFLLFPPYVEIEKITIKTNINRVLNSILRETSHLDNVCYTWTLGYDMTPSRNTRWMKEKAGYESFASGDFEFLCLVDNNIRIIFAEGYDIKTRARKVPAVFSDTAAINRSGIINKKSDPHRLGIIRTEYGFMITSVRPVLARGDPGHILGYLVMGKYLKESLNQVLVNQKEDNFKIIDANDRLSSAQTFALKELQQKDHKILITREAETIYIYFLIPDIDGKYSILIEELFPSIIKEARRFVRISLLIALISVPVMVYIFWLLLERHILRPISILKEQINTITEGDYKKESRIAGNDEFGMLSHVIDNMAQTINSRNDELKSLNSQLEVLSITDGLTGIYNRRYFDEVMNSEWNRACRNRLPLSVIMCDIDLFKKYNDLYGHRAGDECIIMIAGALKDLIHREGDNLFRYGGEEFIAVLPNTSPEGAVQKAISFLRAVFELDKKHENSPDYGVVTISAGVSSIIPDKNANSGYLVGLADSALYKSKQNGRNRVNYAEVKENGEVIFSEYVV